MKNELTKYYDFPTFFGKPFLKDIFGYWDENLPSLYKNQMGSVNISENEKNYVLEISVPGFKKDEIKISLQDGYITITGEEKKETVVEKDKYSRREFHKSSFKRSFLLPDDITDEMIAKLDDGILTITLNKKEPEPKKEVKNITVE